MLESFFVQSHKEFVVKQWRQKGLLSSEILKMPPLRELRPEVVGDRTRMDLMWYDQKLGIRGPAKSDFSFDFFPIKNPDTASSGVLKCMQILQENPLPVEFAQLRLRESMHGDLGVWLDCANESIQTLLHEKGFWLDALTEQGLMVEMGQKHKQALHSSDKGWYLGTATSQCWLPSFDQNNAPIQAQSLISLFSQPGPEVNRALFAAAFDLLENFSVPSNLSWCEWGAGYGNLSLGFASRLGRQGWVSEFDRAAVEYLEQNVQSFAPHLQVSAQAAEKDAFPEAEFWLIDPPRSGFATLLKKIGESLKSPRWILAFHCHQQGLIGDSSVLREKAYSLRAWSSVDAFPGTPHHEVLSLWEKT